MNCRRAGVGCGLAVLPEVSCPSRFAAVELNRCHGGVQGLVASLDAHDLKGGAL